MKTRLSPASALAALTLLAVVPAVTLPLTAAPTAPEDRGWSLHGLDTAETRHSDLAGIDTANVGQLGLAWVADFDARSLRGVEGTPLVVGTTMYATGPWGKVLALDARTGRQLWSFDPEIEGAYARRGCCDVVNRGLAYDQGRLYLGAFDGRLIALDARTGRKLWQVQTTDKGQNYTITGAPRVIKGRVIIGNGGAEYAVRGFITAYDGATGKKLWRFYTVPGDPAKGFENKAMAMAAKTWSGEWWKVGGGGTAWDSMAYDPALDLLYVGVGNGGPWDRMVRSKGQGDNLFVSSIVAIRPETGEYVWHFQEVPGDEWDYTATQHMILADLPIGGRMRKVIMQAPKNGYFYVLDRETGEFLSGTPYVTVNWSKGLDPRTGRPDIVAAARYAEEGKAWMGMPSPAGGHSWQPMSYDPASHLVFLPTAEMPYGYVADKPGSFAMDPRGWNTGQDPARSSMPEDPKVRSQIRAMMKGALVAWDPVAGKRKWEVPMPMPWNGGVLSTAGGLVFQGNATGEFAAYAAQTGQKLWSMDLGTGIVAPPITYRIAGVQYVSVAVGWGGILPLNMGEALGKAQRPRVNRIVTFKLGGKANYALQPLDPQTLPDLPAGVADAGLVDKGRTLYHVRCWMCHGDSAVNKGGVPNLRYSPAIADPALFSAFVLQGAGEPLGMPNFSKDVTPDQAEAIRAYVVKRARDLKADPDQP